MMTNPLAKIDKKTMIMYPAVFAAGLVLFVLLLVGVAMIPRSMIEKHMLESAEYMKDYPNYYYVIDDIDGTRVDCYADAVLLSIIWEYDSDHPLSSVMWSSYYSDFSRPAPLNFAETVFGLHDTNQQYLRYWHGSGVIVRLFHLIGSIKQIYILNAAVIAFLSIYLIYKLIVNRLYNAVISFVLSLISINIWVVPLSMEYYWMFLVMLIASIVVINMALNEKTIYTGIVFMIIGMATAYLDFLTNEIITLLIPLMLMLSIYSIRHEMREINYFSESFKIAFSWIIGYIGTWSMKWGIAAVVLRINVFPYITENIEKRLRGEYYIISGTKMMADAIKKNIKCIFPFEYGVVGFLGVIVLLLVVAYLCYVYRRKKADVNLVLCYSCIGLMPYIRYLIMRNHSYIHYFFTYRTQIVSVMAIGLIVCECIDIKKIGISVRSDKKR